MNVSIHIGLIFVLFTIWMGGCNSVIVGDSNGLEIHIQNESSYTMENVTVVFPADTIEYGDIAPGGRSGYRNVTKAYRYAYIETVVDGKELVLQPIDYVGESLLEPGQYTYELDLNEEMFNSDNYQFALSLQLSQQ